jgi:two-component system, NtrC family, response regulator GlrR
MVQPRITVLDDQHGQRIGAQVKATLERESNYVVDLIDEPLLHKEGVLVTLPDLIIPILSASEKKAKELLDKLGAVQGHTPLLPVIRSQNLEKMLNSFLLKTTDFLATPLQEAEVRARVRRLLVWSHNQQRGSGKQEITETFGPTRLVGEDPAFVAVKRKIPLLAQFESSVLVTGETGTGKEMCARALHYLSRRAGKPFLPVNCGAIPVELFENELFGHQKGTFTSAWAAQPGLIAEAHNGTLFLDEIETLSLPSQVKLLRFLQDKTYYILGSPKPRLANVWIIASANVELPRKIEEGTFREDLFYRLAVTTLGLPPLRQRKADIPLLAAHFWKLYEAKTGRTDQRLSPKAVEALCQHSWPGNVRELENVIQQIIVLTESQTVEPEDLPIPCRRLAKESSGDSFKRSKALAIEDFEKAYVREFLRAHQGNVSRAANAAKMERRAFGRLIKKYQIAKA